MKRWNMTEHTETENPKLDEFLEHLSMLCEEYGFSIAHEDRHGGFWIEPYDSDNIDWIMSASDNTGKEL